VHASGLQELHCKVAIRQDGISPICLDGVALADIEVRPLEDHAAASLGVGGVQLAGAARTARSRSASVWGHVLEEQGQSRASCDRALSETHHLVVIGRT
jgi:hypothetical protein